MSLFQETFKIKEIQKDFDTVSRIIATAGGKSLTIDVHNIFFDFYSENNIFLNKKFQLTLTTDASGVSDHDYSMHGIVYKIDGNDLYVSHGGLLMKLNDSGIEKEMLDKKLFCLINIIN